MPQHGRHPAAAVDPPVRRFGGLSVETALVLALVILIAGGSLIVQALIPSKRETTTVVGDKKVRVTTVGKGGVLPGEIEPRAVIPVVVPTAIATIAPPKSIKTTKPKPTATAIPVATTKPGDDPKPGGGGGGGGGGSCTILILCKPGETPPPTTAPAPETGGVDATTEPGPGPTATPKPK